MESSSQESGAGALGTRSRTPCTPLLACRSQPAQPLWPETKASRSRGAGDLACRVGLPRDLSGASAEGAAADWPSVGIRAARAVARFYSLRKRPGQPEWSLCSLTAGAGGAE